MSEKIQITQEDIDRGVQRNPSNCAIAVGLQHEFAYDISVTDVIQIGNDKYQATPEVVRWFADFDMGRPVNPITIKLVSYPFGKTYRPRGGQPIQVCGIARIAHSHRFRHNLRRASTMKIQITQQHIDTGRVGDAFNCAIAVGLRQEFAYEIGVASWIRIGKDNYQAMPEVVRWFGDFDMGRPVNPITIELVSYPFGRTYRPRGRQPIPICGVARVADSQS